MAAIQDFRVRKGLIVSENASITGNVAITQQLSVTNAVSFSNTLSVTGTSTLTGNTTIAGFANVGGSLQVTGVAAFGTSNVTFDTSTLSIDATNNRIGVNTALGQTVAFVVTGAANVIGTFTSTDIAATANITSTAINVGTGNSQFDSGVLFVDAVNNRVGINNTTPDAALTVTGSANVSGAMRVSGAFTGVLAASFANTLSVGGLLSPSAGINVTGSANVSTTLGVVGAATFSNTLSVVGAITASGGIGGNLNGIATNCSRSIVPGYYMTGGGALTANVTINVDATTGANPNKVVARDGDGSISANVVTANYLTGISGGAQTLLYNSGYRGATEAATANTIVARDVNANFSANLITATATSARYADLAEMYTTTEEYIPGTVVVIAESDDAECTASQYFSQLAIGVVSTNPAYLMNANLNGQPIALKGRVPVRVVGSIRKGQTLVAGPNGCAVAGDANKIAIALETNHSHEEKLVECFII